MGEALTGHPKSAHGFADRLNCYWRDKLSATPPPSIKRTHMELGGKAPVIVFDDADLDAVVEGVRTFGYYNAGQDCTAACRIYAQKGHLSTNW